MTDITTQVSEHVGVKVWYLPPTVCCLARVSNYICYGVNEGCTRARHVVSKKTEFQVVVPRIFIIITFFCTYTNMFQFMLLSIKCQIILG